MVEGAFDAVGLLVSTEIRQKLASLGLPDVVEEKLVLVRGKYSDCG